LSETSFLFSIRLTGEKKISFFFPSQTRCVDFISKFFFQSYDVVWFRLGTLLLRHDASPLLERVGLLSDLNMPPDLFFCLDVELADRSQVGGILPFFP